MSAFGMGGWWLGSTHMEPNTNFLPDVLKKVPKDAKLIVVCQKGLRSLAACEQLSRAGYQTLAWINGGLDTAKPGELASKDGKDLRLAGIGGLSAALGWTELQQEEQKGVGQNVGNILKAVSAVSPHRSCSNFLLGRGDFGFGSACLWLRAGSVPDQELKKRTKIKPASLLWDLCLKNVYVVAGESDLGRSQTSLCLKRSLKGES